MGHQYEEYWDVYRYLDKIKEAIRENLPNIIPNVDLEGSEGEVSIEINDIEPVWFKPANEGGGGGFGGEGGGEGEGSSGSKEKKIIVKVPIEKFKEMVWDFLKLPNLKPKGGDEYEEESKMEGYTNRGPASRLDLFKTLYEIVASGGYMHDGVFRYRDMRVKKVPIGKAVVAFARDTSGSITDEMVSTMRVAAWWIMEWLKRNYPHVDRVFVIHDHEAMETDQEGFLFSSSSGGTVISTAFELIEKIFDERYETETWNRYIVYFSDGEDEPGDFNKTIQKIEKLSEKVELIAYGEVSPFGGRFSGLLGGIKYTTLIEVLKDNFGDSWEKKKNVRYAPLSMNNLWRWLQICFSDHEGGSSSHGVSPSGEWEDEVEG